MWNSPDVGDAPDRVQDVDDPLAARSRTSRSVPKSLIELAPLTPESASSTLSRISCEKLKLTDGNVLELLHQLVLDLLAGDLARPDLVAQDRDRLVPPLLHRDQGGVELEVEKAGDVGAVVGPADLRHHALDLGDRADHLAEPGRHPRRLLKRHRPRQDAADPEVPFLQRRHELAAQLGNQRDREGQQRRPSPPGAR